MTDEEMACKAICDSIPCKTMCTKCKCYIAGLKAGRETEREYVKNNAFTSMKEQGLFPFGKWHKVADGDLPKVGQKCYFIHSNSYGKDNKVIFSESNIKIRTGVYTFILDEETGDETTETCFYDDIIGEEINLTEVYVWKEIVLPKEVKENERNNL